MQIIRISKGNKVKFDKFAKLMSCEMKKGFTSYDDALKTGNRVYICDYCHCYHTTHLQRKR